MAHPRAELEHAKKNPGPFTSALARATMVVRSNSKLIAADKIRETIAWDAALNATGFPKVMTFPKGMLLTIDVREIVDKLFADAVEAARHGNNQDC